MVDNVVQMLVGCHLPGSRVVAQMILGGMHEGLEPMPRAEEPDPRHDMAHRENDHEEPEFAVHPSDVAVGE